MKKTLIGLSLAVMTAVVYQWGLADGQQGSSSGVIATALAAESPAKASPVKASARDFYAPNSEDLAPDEMRLIA